MITLGIDATNISVGGGITHLIELTKHFNPDAHRIKKLVIFSSKKTLDALPNASYLKKVWLPAFESNFIYRVIWRLLRLNKYLEMYDCDLLYVPGGIVACNFHPAVTMSRNMLPFEWSELRRYSGALDLIKNMLLRYMLIQSFSKADGVIYLTAYARNKILNQAEGIKSFSTIINHGVSDLFKMIPRDQNAASSYNFTKPFKFLYVSSIEPYKHHINVCEAFKKLNDQGYPLAIDFIGYGQDKYVNKLRDWISRNGPKSKYISYLGAVPYAELNKKYSDSDAFLFASSCENMPNILVEAMSSGLPIACSNRGPMPEILLDSGVSFDPESVDSIAKAILQLFLNEKLRTSCSMKSHSLSLSYSWDKCADKTFEFINNVYEFSLRKTP